MSFLTPTGIDKSVMPSAEQALPGRADAMVGSGPHRVLANSLYAPWPAANECVLFGMGCFWGAEKIFWQQQGVFTTAVGYSAGYTANPSYEEVCSGMTGHNEVVLVVFDPRQLPFEQLLKLFWEGHDSTQGMRQGNDCGSQYRSGIYCFSEPQLQQAQASRDRYQLALQQNGGSVISTELLLASEFYYAEPYHQQYLAANPSGYCGLHSRAASGRPLYRVEP